MKSAYPSSGDKVFEDLRYNGKFLEAFTYAWGIVESNIDNRVVCQFGFVTEKKADLHPKTGHAKVKYLVKSSFTAKIDFLKETGQLDADAYHILKDFADKRNELFHGQNYSMRFLQLTDAEKQKYLDIASSALRL
jgi:hypothetical protein